MRRVAALLAAASMITACGTSASNATSSTTIPGPEQCAHTARTATRLAEEVSRHSPAHRYPPTITGLTRDTEARMALFDAIGGGNGIDSFLTSPHAIEADGWTLTM